VEEVLEVLAEDPQVAVVPAGDGDGDFNVKRGLF
jgi:hypothetical protein